MLRNFVRLNPAALIFAANAFIAALVAWGWHPSPGVTGLVDGVITAVATIVTAASTRPVGLQLIVGGAAAIMTAVAPFLHPGGLNVTDVQIGATLPVLSLILAGIFHLAHVPYSAAKQGTTAGALQGVHAAGSAR